MDPKFEKAEAARAKRAEQAKRRRASEKFSRECREKELRESRGETETPTTSNTKKRKKQISFPKKRKTETMQEANLTPDRFCTKCNAFCENLALDKFAGSKCETCGHQWEFPDQPDGNFQRCVRCWNFLRCNVKIILYIFGKTLVFNLIFLLIFRFRKVLHNVWKRKSILRSAQASSIREICFDEVSTDCHDRVQRKVWT